MSLAALESAPRVHLGHFPTRLEPLPRLTAVLGGPRLWVKRDDVVGPGTGGNKTRKLEYLFGDAQACRAEVVATFGGLQSNFARQMASAARKLGLAAHCFYFEHRPRRLTGNLLKKADSDERTAASARELIQPPDWNSPGARRLHALVGCLTLPPNWRDPDFVTLRDAYQLHARRQRKPDARLYPGDEEIMARVPNALDYIPVYGGRDDGWICSGSRPTT